MQEDKFHGNELALSVACNAFEDVLEGNNKALFISGAKGVGKSALIKKLRTKLASPDMLNRYSGLAGRQLDEGFIHFIDGGGVSSLTKDCYAVVVIDEIQDCNDQQLSDIRETVRSLASSCLHYLLILSYTNGGIISQPSMLLPTLAEIKGILTNASVNCTDIEVKPMTLADIATTIAFTMSPNDFPSNFVNKLYALTNGVQLYLRETFAYLRETGALTVSNGRWHLSDDPIATEILDNPISIEELEAKRIERLVESVDKIVNGSASAFAPTLLQLCRNYAKHHIIAPDAAATLVRIAPTIIAGLDDDALAQSIRELLPSDSNAVADARPAALLINADNISRADEILAPLAEKYKMSDLLQNVQYMLDILPDDDFRSRSTALKYKCDALIFLGMYHDAYDAANQFYEIAKRSDDSRAYHKALYRRGYAMGLLQDFDTGDRCLDEAIGIATRLSDRASIRKYVCVQASLKNDRPDHKEALKLADFAYKSAEQDGDIKTQCQALIVMTQAHKSLFDMDRAKVEAMLAIKLLQDIDEPRLNARAHAALGSYYQSNHENDKALEYYQKAEQWMLQINDMPGIAGLHINIGNLLCDTSNYDDAIKHFLDALSTAKSLNILSKMLGAYIGIGSANIYKGNSSQAERYLNEAMNVANQIGSNWALAYANSSLGEYYQQIGECEEALAFYKQSLEIDRRNNDDINVYCDLINIASMCSYTDRIDEGIQHLIEAEAMPVDRIKQSMAGSVNNTFGGLYYAKADYEMALSHYQKALEEDIKSNHQINTAISYGNISGTYFALNQYDKAVENAEKAIAIDRQLNDNLQLANHLARQANNYQAQEKFAESRDLYLETARLFRGLNILDDEAMMLRNAAANMHDLEEDDAAEKTLRDALAALEESGNYQLQPDIIKMLAILASEDERDDEAITLYKKAAAIYTDHDLEPDEIYGEIYQSMAELYFETEQNNDATECYIHLADVFEDVNIDYSVENMILAGKSYMQDNNEQGATRMFDKVFASLEKMTDNDLRAAATSDLGDYLCWRKNTKDGIDYKVKSINDIKDTTENKALLARLYYTLAERLHEQKRFYDSLENYYSSLRIYQDTNDYWQQAFVCNNIGFTYDTIGQMKTASQFYHRAYNCYKETGDLDGMYNNLNNEALMLEKIGQMEDSAACYRAALDLLQKNHADPAEIARTALNIAKCLMFAGSDDAVKYFNLAYTNYKDMDMLDEMISCLDFLAMFYVSKQNITSAKSCVNVAQTLLNGRHAYETQAKINNLIGCIYTYIWEPVNAIESFYKSLRILAEHDQWKAMAHCHFLMATKLMHNEDHLNDPIEVKGKTEKVCEFCMEFLDFAVKTAEKENDQALLSDSLGTRSLLHWNANHYDLFEEDMQNAISKATTDVSRVSLMLHSGVLDMMRKNFDSAEQKFIETYHYAVQKYLFEEQLTAKAWLCYMFFEKKDIPRAATLLNELRPNIELALTKVPGLAGYLSRR